MTLKNTFNVVLLAIPSTVETQQLIMFPPCQIKKNHLIGSNKCFFFVMFSAMVMLWAVPTVSVPKKWNQRTVRHLISYSNDSDSDNPPPDSPLTLHSHLTSILYIHSYPMPTLSLHGHLTSTLSLHGHLKSTLPLQTGTLLSLPRVTFPKPQS